MQAQSRDGDTSRAIGDCNMHVAPVGGKARRVVSTWRRRDGNVGCMKAFDVTSKTPADFLASIEAALKGRSLGDIVSMRRDGKDVVITFSRLGTSEVRYSVNERDGGF